MPNRKDLAGTIILDESLEQIVLVKGIASGKLGLPKGHVEHGEVADRPRLLRYALASPVHEYRDALVDADRYLGIAAGPEDRRRARVGVDCGKVLRP
jgi:hypothetical protein